jgi:hypothetical protein
MLLHCKIISGNLPYNASLLSPSLGGLGGEGGKEGPFSGYLFCLPCQTEQMACLCCILSFSQTWLSVVLLAGSGRG